MPLTDSGLEAAFTLETQKSGVVEEPPFHILALGDWSGDGEKRDPADRRPIEIDRDNFDEVIGRLKTRAVLDFADGSALSLDFASLDDFHPDEIVRRVPLFDELRDLRRRINNPDTFNSAAREVRSMFGTVPDDRSIAAAPAEKPADNLLDAILTQPSGGAPAPRPGVSDDLGRLVSDLVRPHLVSVDENEQSAMLAAVDSATSDLMRKILHHRAFQILEAAWRGLYFLARRTETSSGLKIFLLDFSKAELADSLKSVSTLTESNLYRHLVKETVETPGGDPFSLVCANYAFSPNVDDIAMLMRVSKISAAAGAPFVSHMRPDVLGVHSLAEHPDPSEWKVSSETEAGKLWAALRGQAESEYLGMSIPRFLLRLPYGADTDPLETFSFEEFADAPVHDYYLWANGSFAVATLYAQSFSEHGWEMGRRLIQDLDGLPVHIYGDGGETIFKPCAEIQLTDKGVDKLMEYGLMPLVSYRAADRIKLARFQSIADPVNTLRGRWN